MNKNNLDESFSEPDASGMEQAGRQDLGLIPDDAVSIPASSTDLPETASNSSTESKDSAEMPETGRAILADDEVGADADTLGAARTSNASEKSDDVRASGEAPVAQISAREERVFFSSGDLGDCIAMLAVIKHLGGGRLLLGNRGWTKQITGERFNYIAPLLRMQPYLASVEEHEGDLPSNCLDFSHFRQRWQEAKTLVGMHCVYAGLHESAVDPRIPWLTIPDYAHHGKIVIACSSRYQGALHYFRIVRAKALDCLFIGLPDEYEQFCWNQGAPNQRNKVGVRYQPVRDAVEAAQVIMGARLYVGNPTSSTWIAIGCGHPNMLLDCSQRDTDIDRAGVRNVRSVGDNPKLHEWAAL